MKKSTVFIIIFIGMIVSYSLFLTLGDEPLRALSKEDGVVEWIGALGFLAASIMFFCSWKMNKSIFLLLLGILFLVAFGEEISWGQRIFDIKTPEVLKAVNVQGEINIHNLKIFHGIDASGGRKSGFEKWINFDRLFTLFWFGFCCLIPMFAQLNQKLKDFLNSIKFPIIPLWIGCLFLLNYVLYKIMELFVSRGLREDLIELKESLFALLFFWAAMVLHHFIKQGFWDESK